jgi:hypothetical protein
MRKKSNSISQARERLYKIKRYCENAGQNWYSQAKYQYDELLELYKKANMNDQPIIRELLSQAKSLIDKRRDEESFD